MGGSNQQVKSFITAAYNYFRNKSEKNSVAVQKQLQGLIKVHDVQVFEPSSSESLELLSCLENFFTVDEVRSTVAGKALTLLTHICDSCNIREALRDDIKIIPVLSNFCVQQKLSRDNLLKTLTLLHITTYKVQIAYLEDWVVKLLPFLTATVTKATVGDETLVVALQILTNLCRSNASVMECLRRLPNIKTLLTTLSRLKNATMYIRLLTLEMLFFIDAKISAAIFSNNEIVDMIFLVAMDGFEEDKRAWLRLSADVFQGMVVVPSLEPIFRDYQKYGQHLDLLLSRMTPDTPEPLAEALMDFIGGLVHYNHQDIRTLHEAVFVKMSKWMSCHGCGESSVRVVRELLVHNGAANTLTSASLDTFVEGVKTTLTCSEDNEITATELHHITVIFTLMDQIPSYSEALHLKLAWKLEPSIFSNLVRKILLFESHSLPGGEEDTVCSDKSLAESSGYESTTGSRPVRGLCPPQGSGVSRCDLQLSLKKTMSKGVILILAVMKSLGAVKSEHLAEYRKMMGLPAVMKHLMWGGLSGLTDYATKAWDMITDGSLAKECLEVVVSATGESGLVGSYSRTYSLPHLAPSAPHLALAPSAPHLALAPSPSVAQLEEKVDTLIGRLLGTVNKMEIKDCNLTDVIDMYEYKLASLAHSERALEEALIKADIQNRQNSLLRLRTSVQNDHLRSLLSKWECELQKVRAEKEELQATIEDLGQSSEDFKNKFISEIESLERRNKDLKKELVVMESCAQANDDKINKLQHQLSLKQDEMKKQQAILNKEQERGTKLSKQVQKLEGEMKQSGRSVEDLKKEIETLKNIKGQLQKENVDLEAVVKSKDEALSGKEEQLDEALIKLNKMLEIQNMIHDISSRSVAK